MLANVIIVAVVALGVFFGARRAWGSATGKRDCCSGAAKGGKSFRARKIEDTNEADYPYSADYKIAGMHCENCARNVTNALDSVDGTWARVDLDSRTAHVLSKKPLDRAAYERAVDQAGYRLLA